MEPHDRDENQENILKDMIRGDDVSKQFLNDSGEGDESLNRGDGSDAWGERELGSSDAWGERELGGSDEGEADKGEAGGSGETLEIVNSDEVHIYILIN